MKEYKVEEKEIFSLLTSKQVAQISDIAKIKHFSEGQLIYDHKELAQNLYILLEGEAVLKLPGGTELSHDSFTIEIDRLKGHGVFGPDLLFGIKRYITRAKAVKPSKIMVLDAEKFLQIIKENKSEFIIMSYLAKVYFQRYVNAMKEFQHCVLRRDIPLT